ncbi:MAG TPA: hypothetical protein VGK67_35320 [Myxococcales bacterium]|jgi:hypothetical protein
MNEQTRFSTGRVLDVVADIDPDLDSATIRQWRSRGILAFDDLEGDKGTSTYGVPFIVGLRVLLDLRAKGMPIARAAKVGKLAANIVSGRSYQASVAAGRQTFLELGRTFIVVDDSQKEDDEAVKANRIADMFISRGRGYGTDFGRPEGCSLTVVDVEKASALVDQRLKATDIEPESK